MYNFKSLTMNKKQEKERKNWLITLAKMHRDKWVTTGDIKLLKIAHDLEIEASYWSVT